MKKIFMIFLMGFFLVAALHAENEISITSPAAGEELVFGTTFTIRWVPEVIGDHIRIELHKKGEENRLLAIAPSTISSGSHSWEVPSPGAMKCFIRIIDRDRNWTGDSGVFALRPRRNTVAVIWPNGGETVTFGSLRAIKWKPIELPAGARADIVLLKNGVEVATIIRNCRAGSGNTPWHITEDSVYQPGDGYTISVRPRGGYADASDRPFSIAASTAAGDLELVRLSGAGGDLCAHIKSTFPTLARHVTYEITRPSWAPTRVERRSIEVDFAAPGEKEFVLERILPTDLESGGDIIHSHYEVVLDPDNILEEANEHNNRKSAALCGHAVFPMIEKVYFGNQEAQRGQTLVVRNGRVDTRGNHLEVYLRIRAMIRNYGYAHMEGHLRVAQIGIQPQYSRENDLLGGYLMESYERQIANPSCNLPAGNPPSLHEKRTLDSTRIYMFPTDILVEVVWDGPGAHTHMAKFRFAVDFSQMPHN
jgi:hypothetical protein